MPSSKNYVRNYAQEDSNDSAKRKHQRVVRNTARRLLEKKGVVHEGDGKDVDHIRPLSHGGSGLSLSNLRIVSASNNRSFKRNSKGALVSQTSTKERKGRK